MDTRCLTAAIMKKRAKRTPVDKHQRPPWSLLRDMKMQHQMTWQHASVRRT